MRLLTAAASLLFTVMFAVALQQPAPIPPFEGDGNEQHDGQPKWCQDRDDEHLHNCECSAEGCGGKQSGENPKCKVYCRKDACRCSKPCRTMR